MYTTILVPLDGSSFGEHALPLALSIARQNGALLHLVHVHVADDRRTNDITSDAQQRERERAYLTGVTEQLMTVWPGRVVTTLLDGPVADAIANDALASAIDLVVMTTHGRGALSRAWLGSVADRLLRRLGMPVLLVRPHETDQADVANPPSIKHILIPLDESELSECIIAHALALGRLMGARYTLLQAVELLAASYGLEPSAPSAIEIDTWMQEAQRYLDRVAAGLRAEGLQVQTEVSVGPPAMSILEYARNHTVDLIALETHGRSGAARLFLGSVADKIVRGAAVPVLLHRPQSETTTP